MNGKLLHNEAGGRLAGSYLGAQDGRVCVACYAHTADVWFGKFSYQDALLLEFPKFGGPFGGLTSAASWSR